MFKNRSPKIDTPKTYLVTGGCGFIGSHLVDALLARGDNVRVLDDLSTGKMENIPAACEMICGDVTDTTTVRRAMHGVDGCWHLAAIACVDRSNKDWLATHQVNLSGTIQVLEASRQTRPNHPIPVVYASSAAVFGDNARIPFTERSETRPLSAYGADKLGSELHARVGTLIHGIPSVGLRFFNVYGSRQDPRSPYSGVISFFIERIRQGESCVIHGDGEQSRDFIHVSDVVQFLLKSMGRGYPLPEIYNVCTGRQTTIIELAKTLFKICDHTTALTYGPKRSGDIRFSVGDPSQATKHLGLTAAMPLLQGLERTLRQL